MDVNLITVDREVAREKLAAYQKSRSRNAEYDAAMLAFREAANGRPLINLSQVINAAGWGEDRRPLLAVGRADRNQVCVIGGNNRVTFSTQKNPTAWGADTYVGTLRLTMPTTWGIGPVRGYSLVPMVPADIRPKGNLKDFFVLWEVKGWSDAPFRAEPDRDPLLLKHLFGDLYVVVAEWDLTPIEQAIMAGRREG